MIALLKRAVFFSVLLFLFVTFLVCTVFFMSLLRVVEEEVEKNSSYEYQYFEIDYDRNDIYFGSVQLPNEIEDEFISHDDFPNHKSVLISSFGTEGYECTGSCYCDDLSSFRRHSHSQVLIEGVSYFLAAASSLVAIDLTKAYFSEKCSEKYSNYECDPESIKTEITNCEKLIEVDDDPHVERRVYFCYGNCIDNLQYGSLKTRQLRPSAKDLGLSCESLKAEGEMVVYSNSLLTKSPKRSVSSNMGDTARYNFLWKHLIPHCRENSKVDYEYSREQYYLLKSGEKKKYTTVENREGQMCVGIRSHFGVSQTQNVKCRQIHPKPTSRNTKYWDNRFWKEKEEWDKL